MRLAIFSIVLALGMSGCASQPIAVINAAADAVGDAAGIKAVNTLVRKGKLKNFKGKAAQLSDVKKAFVTLAEGQKLDVTTGL